MWQKVNPIWMRVWAMKSWPCEWYAKTKMQWADFFVEDIKIRDFIEKISEDDDEQYLSKFILYMYNYKRWFLNKKGRLKKINKKWKIFLTSVIFCNT